MQLLKTIQAGVIIGLAVALTACNQKKESSDSSDLMSLLARSGGTGMSASNMAEQTALNGETEMGNPRPGRAPGHLPLWPARGDFGFFSEDILSAADGTHNVTVTSETKACPDGGSVVISGSQTATVSTSGSVKTITATGGTRTIQYNACKPNPMVTIASGTLTVTQTGTATLLVKEETTELERHSLSGLVFQVQGTIQVEHSAPSGMPAGGQQAAMGPGGPGGQGGPGGPRPPQSGSVAFDLRSETTNRVLIVYTAGTTPTQPLVIERSGSIAGTITVNGKTETIQRTLTNELPPQ